MNVDLTTGVKEIPNNILPEYRWTNFDFGFFQHGDYVSDTLAIKKLSSFFYPMRELVHVSDRIDNKIINFENNNALTLKNKDIPVDWKTFIPNYLDTEVSLFLCSIYCKRTKWIYVKI